MNRIVAELEEYLPDIYKCINTGFSEAMRIISKSGGRFDKISASSFINSSIRLEAKRIFPDELFIENNKRLVALLINNTIVRFKKFGKNRLPSNIPTSQARKFAAQQLPGFERAVNLNAGWILDTTGTKIQAIFLACPASLHETKWMINIGDYLDHNNMIPIPPIARLPETIQRQQLHAKLTVKPEAKNRRKTIKVKNE